MTLTTNILSNYKHIFANDPIVITAETVAADVPATATLAQLVIRVTAHLANSVNHIHEIAQQFIPGDTLYTDISSALQAEYQIIDRQSEPFPVIVPSVATGSTITTETYNPFHITIESYVRYLINGTEYNGHMEDGQLIPNPQGIITILDGIYVLRGGLQPQLRQTLALSPSAAVQALAASLTTKPNIPAASVQTAAVPQQALVSPTRLEVHAAGDTHLTSSYDATNHTVTTNATPLSTEALTPSVVGGSPTLIVESNPHRRQLIFRNSLGVLETFSVLSLSKRSLSVSSEEYAILSAPSYSPSLNLLTQAQNPSQKWEMSTGSLPAEWVEWFTREVLTATYVWMPVPILNPTTGATSLVKLPIHLESESVTLEEQTKTQLTEVKFDVTTPPIA